MVNRLMVGLLVGNLEISNASAVSLVVVSLFFLVCFVIVSLKNDSQGMMEWMFDKSSERPKEIQGRREQ